MRIMTERSFPFPLLGLVHIGNEITQHRPISAGRAAVAVRVRARGPRAARPRHAVRRWPPRRAWAASWCGSRAASTCTATGGSAAPRAPRATTARRAPPGAGALARAGRHRPPLRRGVGRPQPDPPAPAGARSCSACRARSRTGCGCKARCLAELEPTLPDAFTVDVRFKLPLFLPAQVAFGVRDGGELRGPRREQRQAAPRRDALGAHERRRSCGSRSASWPSPPA